MHAIASNLTICPQSEAWWEWAQLVSHTPIDGIEPRTLLRYCPNATGGDLVAVPVASQVPGPRIGPLAQ